MRAATEEGSDFQVCMRTRSCGGGYKNILFFLGGGRGQQPPGVETRFTDNELPVEKGTRFLLPGVWCCQPCRLKSCPLLPPPPLALPVPLHVHAHKGKLLESTSRWRVMALLLPPPSGV